MSLAPDLHALASRRVLPILTLLLVAACAPSEAAIVACGPRSELAERATVKGARTVACEARVERLHPSPGVWCGIVATFQEVEATVLRTEAEDGPEGRITIRCALVGPPMTEKDEPVLAAALFAVGRRLRFELSPDLPGRWIAWEAPSLRPPEAGR